MATKYIDVPVTGKLRWEEVGFWDNSSNPEGCQVHKVRETTVRTLRISQFKESTKQIIESTKRSSSVGATIGASYGPLNASITANTTFSKEITDIYSNTIREQKDISISVTRDVDDSFVVAADGKLGRYQAYFSAPGVDVSLDKYRQLYPKPEAEEVQLMVKMQELQFISDIQVIYTDNVGDKPWGNIPEVTGQNEDVNSGFGGKYIWLKPIYTNQVSQAITDCRIRIQDQAWSGGNDLAKGAKGKFRYLEFNKDTNNDLKYSEVKLLRSAGHPKSISEVPGFDVLTTDINKDRKGDFLYLAFKARDALAIERLST